MIASIVQKIQPTRYIDAASAGNVMNMKTNLQYSEVRLDQSVAMARHKTFSLHADKKHHTKSLFIFRRWRFELARTPLSKRF
jgi:hypothetical protein